MDKTDMISLIKAEESFIKLNNDITYLTGGHPVECEEYGGFYEIYNVLKRNSRFPGNSDYDEDMFRSIIYAINKTPEEKYELLCKE